MSPLTAQRCAAPPQAPTGPPTRPVPDTRERLRCCRCVPATRSPGTSSPAANSSSSRPRAGDLRCASGLPSPPRRHQRRPLLRPPAGTTATFRAAPARGDPPHLPQTGHRPGHLTTLPRPKILPHTPARSSACSPGGGAADRAHPLGGGGVPGARGAGRADPAGHRQRGCDGPAVGPGHRHIGGGAAARAHRLGGGGVRGARAGWADPAGHRRRGCDGTAVGPRHRRGTHQAGHRSATHHDLRPHLRP